MPISGKHLIGGERSAAGRLTFTAKSPITGEELSPRFTEATDAEVDRCLKLAYQAFVDLQQVDSKVIAELLDAIAAGLERAGEPLLSRIHAETGLPMARLESERARTVNQTLLFARLVREGSWIQARIDCGDPTRKPLPKPDVRTMLKGIGPIAVFGASNFPLAISVAGTDTVAAFAAKCPVVVKAHPGHPGTCEMIADIVCAAIARAGLPSGMFSMLQGAGDQVGRALVEHPLTAAVAFTGSLRGGRALFDAAVRRPVPIPVYAEMGSSNPVFILFEAARDRADQIAAAYIQSVTLGGGQFCTKPGSLLIEQGDSSYRLSQLIREAVAHTPPGNMLHAGIHKAYIEGRERIRAIPGVEVLAQSAVLESTAYESACTIFSSSIETASGHPEITDEVFGPMSVVFQCKRVDQMYEFAKSMPGQLTATIHGSERDLAEHSKLVQILERKVGRIVFNGFPTGIEVCPAIHHGGPYPATTHSHHTSIGSFAVYRFTKPVCYQDFPEAALPAALRNCNELGIARLVDGKITTADA